MPSAAHPGPEVKEAPPNLRGERGSRDLQRPLDLGGRGARVERSVEVSMQLALLPERGTDGDDAELAPPEVEPRTSEHLAVPVGDHPGVEGGVKRANVRAKALVHVAVDRGARALSPLPPPLHAPRIGALVIGGRGAAGGAAPLARGVERARE